MAFAPLIVLHLTMESPILRTLKDRLSGHVIHGTKSGPVPYLTTVKEKELEDYLVTACNCGYGKTRKQVKSLIERVAFEKGTLRSNRVSDDSSSTFCPQSQTTPLGSSSALSP